jgi:hypothetical protein
MTGAHPAPRVALFIASSRRWLTIGPHPGDD